MNALITGLGPTEQVVLYDTLLELPAPQVAAVLAHELAHQEHADLARGTLLTATAALVGLLLLRRVLDGAVVRRCPDPGPRAIRGSCWSWSPSPRSSSWSAPRWATRCPGAPRPPRTTVRSSSGPTRPRSCGRCVRSWSATWPRPTPGAWCTWSTARTRSPRTGSAPRSPPRTGRLSPLPTLEELQEEERTSATPALDRPTAERRAVRVLWLTNDLPPRAGGIEQFLGNLLAACTPRPRS
jgi:hypothetical protein